MTKNQETDFPGFFTRAESFRFAARWTLLVVFLVGCITTLESKARAQSSNSLEALSKTRERIGKLINQLGDSSYSNRIRAQGELERIGVIALDQLHAASFHPDPQISSSARYIVQSNQFAWAWDSDPINVRQILSSYAESHVSEKSVYLDQLQRLEHNQGFAALCRLARYETQGGLSKRAAILLMRSRPAIDQSLNERRESLLTQVRGGQSAACRWLLKYSADEPEFDIAWWENTLQEEVNLLRTSSADTNLELVLDLHRWVVEQIASVPKYRLRALELGRFSLELAKTTPTLESMAGNKTARSKEFAKWALKCKLPELVQEQHGKLPYMVVLRELAFGYYLAESFALQGKDDLAEEVADKSFHQIPCDEFGNVRTKNESEVRDPIRNALDSMREVPSFDVDRRRHLGQELQERGCFKWAESEYRGALSLPANDKKQSPFDMTQISTMEVLHLLAAMLHAQGKHHDAVETLEPMMQRLKKEPMFERQMSDFPMLIGSLKSNYHLYLGDELSEAGDVERSQSEYWESINAHSENVDALIGLYRLQLNEEGTIKRRNKLNEIVSSMRIDIRRTEELLKTSTSQMHSTLQRMLSEKCNSLAWVVANTEGNKEEAIFFSRKACGLRPEDAALIDTLAHCYAALGKYDDAVEQQRRAVEIEPHQPELLRSLERFERLLKDSKEPSK